MKFDITRFLRRAIRQGTWPILQRYSVFPKILEYKTYENHLHADFAVHVLVCEKDAIMLHWSLTSLLHHCTTPFTVYIHDDGTCTAKTLRQFRERFPNATIVLKSEATEIVESRLKDYPDLLSWRRYDHIAAKCIDFYLIGAEEWIVILDADVLFFADPKELFKESEDSIWMQDCFYSLYSDPDEAKKEFACEPKPVSGGLGRMRRNSFDVELLQKVNQFKALPEIKKRAIQRGLPPLEDQTYHALRAAREPNTLYLGHEYQVMIDVGLGGVVAKHYTTPVRLYFYEEGIPRIAKQIGMPLALWLRERL